MSYSITRRNPYIIGRPDNTPLALLGHAALIQFIADKLVQDEQVILILGERRMDMSTLVTYIPYFMSKLAEEPEYSKLKEFAFARLSLEGDSRKSLAEVLHELARDAVQQFDLKVQVPLIQSFETNPQLFADKFIPAMRQELGVKNIVLLLDEFDMLHNSDVTKVGDHLFGYLQTAVYSNPNLYLLPVIGRQLEDLPLLLSLFREAPHQRARYLDRRSIEQFITIPAKGNLEYDSEAIDAIFALSSGHPYFTRVICFALFTNARTEDRWRVIQSDVRDIVERAMELGEGGLGWFWEGIPLPERVIFSAAAEVPQTRQLESSELPSLDFSEVELLKLLHECGVEITKSIREGLANLIDWGFLRSTLVSDSTYCVSIEFVRQWLVKSHPIRREVRELEYLSTEAQKLYESAKTARLRGTTPKIVSMLNEALRFNPNHFEALFELADSLAEMQQFTQALKYYKRAYLVDAVRVRNSYVQTLRAYGEELHGLGETDDAIARLEEALLIDLDNAQLDNAQAKRLLAQIQQIRHEKQDEHPKAIAFLNMDGNRTNNIIFSISSDADLRSLQQNLDQLRAQVKAEAPTEIKHRALERLNELQEELFTQEKVNVLILLYVDKWFRKHLPTPLGQAVTDFLDTIYDNMHPDE